MGSFEGKGLIFAWFFFRQSRFGHIFVDLFCKQVPQLFRITLNYLYLGDEQGFII